MAFTNDAFLVVIANGSQQPGPLPGGRLLGCLLCSFTALKVAWSSVCTPTRPGVHTLDDFCGAGYLRAVSSRGRTKKCTATASSAAGGEEEDGFGGRALNFFFSVFVAVPSPAPDGHSVQHARPRSRRLLYCQQCSYVTLRKSHLVRHQRQHTGERPHPCSHCGKAFTQKTHLNAHLRIHTGECPFRCHLCPRAFTQGSSLASHLRSHAAGTSARRSPSLGGNCQQPASMPDPQLLRCQQCSYMTRHPCDLRRHRRIHTGERPHQCGHCGKAFTQKAHLDVHRRTHTGERPYQCHLCPGTFALKTTLDRHLRTHTGERPYRCHLCVSAFTQKSTLNCHLRRHLGERPFHCRFCPMAFTHRLQQKAHEATAHGHHQKFLKPSEQKTAELARKNRARWQWPRHVRLHRVVCWAPVETISHLLCLLVEGLQIFLFLSIAGRSPSLGGHSQQQHSPPVGGWLLRCHQCSFMTRHPSDLKMHRCTHTGERPHQCSKCGKFFTQKVHLDVHQRTHTGERPHQCSYCGKAFAMKNTLDRHVRIHTGERPYRCQLCPAAFSQKSTLDSHMRRHTGERPFHCHFCPMAFTYRLQQKAHEEKEHGHLQ
ncbi:uncharacterized protein LOC144148236 [Haemaphysalis longicornis]